MNKLMRLIAPGFIPLFLAALFAVFTVFYKALDLPSPAEMARIGRNLYDHYGIVTLILAAFIEGIFMINIYFPGSFVIILAVFLADKTVFSLTVIAVLVWLGFVVAAIINYFLGNYGFYRFLLFLGRKDTVERMQKWMDKRGKLAVFIAAIHPNFLAISQVCMGIAREGLNKNILFSAMSLAFWVPLWTILFAVIVEQVNLEDSNQAWYVVCIFVAWALILIVKELFSRFSPAINKLQ